MSEQTNVTALPEAPASASAKLISPQGVEWLLTMRDFTVGGLVGKIGQLEQTLIKNGWTVAPTRGNGHANGNGNGGEVAPICKYHGPMKRSKKFNGWYCSNKLADGTYCQEKTMG